MVRYAFQVPKLLVLRMKLIALQRETTVSEILREWIDSELASSSVKSAKGALPTDGRVQQLPVTLPRATREAIDQCARRQQISTAQLMRRLITDHTDQISCEPS